jgi:hypothetical protein
VFVHHQNNPEDRFVTYALLDDQSTACFATDALVDKMGLKGVSTRLKLSTVLGEETVTVSCRKVNGLVVRGAKESIEVSLPDVYTRQSIPAQPSQIPIPETARRWHHLSEVAEQLTPFLKDVDIGLLIGMNCPRAIRPMRIEAGDDDDPYGVYTSLGWGVIGMVGISKPGNHFCYATSTICIETLHENHFAHRCNARELNPGAVGRMFELDFSEQSELTSSERTSIEDQRFLK